MDHNEQGLRTLPRTESEGVGPDLGGHGAGCRCHSVECEEQRAAAALNRYHPPGSVTATVAETRLLTNIAAASPTPTAPVVATPGRTPRVCIVCGEITTEFIQAEGVPPVCLVCCTALDAASGARIRTATKITPRSVRETAGACVRLIQTGPRSLVLDTDGQLAWYGKFRDLFASLFLPGPEADLVMATLTTSELQGIDLVTEADRRTEQAIRAVFNPSDPDPILERLAIAGAIEPGEAVLDLDLGNPNLDSAIDRLKHQKPQLFYARHQPDADAVFEFQEREAKARRAGGGA